MRISIITVVLNNNKYIESCINSVLNQTYDNKEYIVIDGGSTDGSVDIIEKNSDKIDKWISEPDKGIYDAMNKGIKMSTGEIIGILNSDDYYESNNVISTVVKEFQDKNVDSVFADLVFVKRDDLQRIIRYYKSSNFSTNKFSYGWMPAHPTFFVKRHCYDRYGLFKTDYRIAADYELLVRFLAKHKISFSYIPQIVIKMRTGGVSTKSIKSTWTLNNEIIRACRENGIETNIIKVYSKYFLKIFEFFDRP